MNSFVTTLDVIETLISELKAGNALRSSLVLLIESRQGPLRDLLKDWFEEFNAGRSAEHVYARIKWAENSNLLSLLEYGLQGFPILQSLEKFKAEVEEITKMRVEQRLQMLPYKMMIPLFLFFFPALMWSFLAPFIREMKNGF